MKKKAVLWLPALLIAGMLSGCGKESEELLEINTKKYVDLGEYKGIEIKLADPEVTQEYLDSYIDYMLTMNSTENEVKDRPVANGDTVNIDYEGKIDGVAFEGGTAKAQDLVIGSGGFIPGFEEGLIGAAIGETRDLNLTFPQNYKEDLAGKAVVFTVKVNSITLKVVPKLTDEIVPTLDPECKTVSEYKEKAFNDLTEQAKMDYEMQLENDLLQKVYDNCTWKKDAPEWLVSRYTAKINENYTLMAQQYGVELDEFITGYFNMTKEAFDEEVNKSAVNTANQSIMLKAISDKEKLKLSAEEVDEVLTKNAEENGYASLEEYKKVISNESYEDYAMINVVIDFMKENAVISSPEDQEAATQAATEAETETSNSKKSK